MLQERHGGCPELDVFHVDCGRVSETSGKGSYGQFCAFFVFWCFPKFCSSDGVEWSGSELTVQSDAAHRGPRTSLEHLEISIHCPGAQLLVTPPTRLPRDQGLLSPPGWAWSCHLKLGRPRLLLPDGCHFHTFLAQRSGLRVCSLAAHVKSGVGH